MEKERHLRLERNYLLASASAVFTAFVCINLYPEHHGGPQIGISGLLALSAAMVAMIVYIVYKALRNRSDDASTDLDAPMSDPSRLRRMFFLWSACTVLLGASLIRYPLYQHFKTGDGMGFRDTLGLVLGTTIIIATLLHVITRVRDYKKL